MALSLNSTATFHPQPSLGCCSTKYHVGLKLHSPNSLGLAKANSNAQFLNTVQKCIVSRRARWTMMPIGTPRVPYRSGEGSWQWVDLWNALYRERVIYLGKHINEEFSNQMIATMLYLDSVNSDNKMYLYINSTGGDLVPSMALYDTMHSLKSPVATHCLGFAFNLAGYILSAGEKGTRTIMPLARIHIYPLSGTAHGQADDISNEANELSKARDYLFKELSEKTGQPLDKIYKDFSRLKAFNAQEAVDYGIVDRIVRPARIEPDALKKDP